jgi:transposase-like protein
MTPTKVPSEILATDTRGRVRVSRERREELLNEFEQSGMTGAQFARTIGLKYQTFAFWRQQRQKRKPALINPAPQEDYDSGVAGDGHRQSQRLSVRLAFGRSPAFRGGH